jgi:two-component system LytT family response regulator
MKELKPNETFLKKENYYIAKLPITEGNETTLLSLDQIIYIEANGAYSCIVQKPNKKSTHCKSLLFFEQQLPAHSFLRVHKSFIVNVIHVQSIIRDKHWQIKLISGQLIPVSDDKKSPLLNMLGLQLAD